MVLVLWNMGRVALGTLHRKTGYGDFLAPQGIPPVLDLEGPPWATRTPCSAEGDPNTDSADEPREPAYSRSGTKTLDKDERSFERSPGRSVSFQGWSRALHGPKHLVVLVFGLASRCYELNPQALDVFPKCFEQRDALGSSDEFSEVACF